VVSQFDRGSEVSLHVVHPFKVNNVNCAQFCTKLHNLLA